MVISVGETAGIRYEANRLVSVWRGTWLHFYWPINEGKIGVLVIKKPVKKFLSDLTFLVIITHFSFLILFHPSSKLFSKIFSVVCTLCRIQYCRMSFHSLENLHCGSLKPAWQRPLWLFWAIWTWGLLHPWWLRGIDYIPTSSKGCPLWRNSPSEGGYVMLNMKFHHRFNLIFVFPSCARCWLSTSCMLFRLQIQNGILNANLLLNWSSCCSHVILTVTWSLPNFTWTWTLISERWKCAWKLLRQLCEQAVPKFLLFSNPALFVSLPSGSVMLLSSPAVGLPIFPTLLSRACSSVFSSFP